MADGVVGVLSEVVRGADGVFRIFFCGFAGLYTAMTLTGGELENVALLSACQGRDGTDTEHGYGTMGVWHCTHCPLERLATWIE